MPMPNQTFRRRRKRPGPIDVRVRPPGFGGPPIPPRPGPLGPGGLLGGPAGVRQNPRGQNSQGGLPGQGVPGTGPRDANGNGIPDRFEAKLKAAGLRLGRGGGIKAPNVYGATSWTPEQIQLMQRAYNRFGIDRNPAFDPNRAAYAGNFYGTPGGDRMPEFIDLGTGASASGQGTATDEQLARLRERTGWSPDQAYAYLAQNGLLPAGQVAQTQEGWQGYIDAARANYLGNAGIDQNPPGLVNPPPIRGGGGPPQGGGPPLPLPGHVGPGQEWRGGGPPLPVPGHVGPGGQWQGQGPRPLGPSGAAPPQDPYAAYRGQAQQATGGLPLTGPGEAGQRQLTDALTATLTQLGVARDQVGPILDLFMARLGTNQGQAQSSLDQSLVGRGIYDSGIRTTDTQNLSTDYNRQRQDALFGATQQYADIDASAAEAYGEFMRQLTELQMNIAGNLAENPSPVLGPGTSTGGRRHRRRRGHRGPR